MEYTDYLKRLERCTAACEQEAAEWAGATVSYLSDYAEDSCQSEIEKVFLVAWLLRLKRYELYGSPNGGHAAHYLFAPNQPGDLEAPVFSDPIRQYDIVKAQYRVLDYRVDFLLRRFLRPEGRMVESGPKVVVECDGHDFHERTKEQAAKDKERDRLLHTAGYIVMRFTGSEIWKDPQECVDQVDELIEADFVRQSRARRRLPPTE